MKRGFTVTELLVSMGILSLLLLGMFAVYRTGASAWKKGDAQTELLQSGQAVAERLQREVERSVYASATLHPGPATGQAVAFLTCWNDATLKYDYDPAHNGPIWNKYWICYHDPATREVRWTQAPYAASTTAAQLPGLGGLSTGGRVLASNVVSCVFTLSEQILEMNLVLEKKRYGHEDPERVEIPAVMYFRN